MKNKFNAKKVSVEIDGTEMRFDSQKEYKYYLLLKEKESNGEIFQLDRQIKFQLQESFVNNQGKRIREIVYIPDFTFIDRENKRHAIDVKGGKITQTPQFKLKAKMFQYIYRDWIFEVIE